MYAQSLATCEKVASLFGRNSFSRAVHSLILAIAGKTEEAKQILSELKKNPKLDSFSLIYLAETCSVKGEKNEAFELLESAYREHVPLLINLGVKPTFDNIRSDPRYANLLHRMGLAETANGLQS
jgi:adenylate cyclase